jgi:alpha-galactosidase
MILNVCNFWTPGKINGTAPSYADSAWDTFSWAPAIAQSWRTDTDIGFVRNIQFQWVLRNLDQDSTPSPNIQDAAGPPGSSGIAWGHYNDPDYLGPELGMTSTQAQSQFSMWAMVAAPLILGSDPRSLSSTSINVLKNPRVIAIDQDSLGVQGSLVSQTSTAEQVWVKPLARGARAVALFNRGSSSQLITTSASAVGLPRASRYTLLDVWTNQTSSSKGKISALVQPDAVVLYRVTADPGCTVPRLIGKTLRAARASLKTARCRLGRATRKRASHARRGRVIAQSPRAGARRRRGAKVKVVLAS